MFKKKTTLVKDREEREEGIKHGLYRNLLDIHKHHLSESSSPHHMPHEIDLETISSLEGTPSEQQSI